MSAAALAAALLLCPTAARAAEVSSAPAAGEPEEGEEVFENEPDPFAAGDHTYYLRHGGRRRRYMIYLPEGYRKEKGYPVVVILEGGRGGIAQMREITLRGFEEVADRDGAILVYPEPIENIYNDGRGVKTFAAHAAKVDDVGFVRRLIRLAVSRYGGLRRRVYLAGFSSGGLMVQRAACALSGVVAGAASVAGGLAAPVAPTCAPLDPVPMLLIHGDKDYFMPYEGKEVRFGNYTTGRKLTVERTFRHWARLNGCRRKARALLLPDESPEDGLRVKLNAHARCREGSEVRLYRVLGGGHTWPGQGQWKPAMFVGRTTRDIDAVKVIWEFFGRHALPKS